MRVACSFGLLLRLTGLNKSPKLPLMNQKGSFESLLCGKSEAGGGKEVTQGLLTGRRLLSIQPEAHSQATSFNCKN